MITRIVRLTFNPENISAFQEIFRESKDLIRNYEGCQYLSLHRDNTDLRVLYTISKWESHEHLEKYRHSALFRETWAKTKILFCDRPQAFSLNMETEIE